MFSDTIDNISDVRKNSIITYGDRREGDRREGDPSTSDAIVFQASTMEILQVGHVADKEISKIKIQFHHHDQ